MTINVHKNKAFCIRCGLKMKFRWWHPRPKQLRQFTAIHDTIVKLRKEHYGAQGKRVNDCGMVIGKRPEKNKK